jgi:hypothetical protein
MESFRAGDYVRFLGCSKEQIADGKNDDPNPLLFIGDKYYVEKVEIRSEHTRLTLRGVSGKFNSVCFKKL